MMRVPEFRYHAPATAQEAAKLLAELGPQARLLAGGTDLIPNMKRRQQTPTHLVALRKVAGLREATADGELSLGAGLSLTKTAQAEVLGDGHRALKLAASKVATPHIQNMGTLGGNLCLDTRCNYYNQNYEWRKAIDFCKKAPDGEAREDVTTGTCWVAPSSPRCWAVSSTDTAPALMALGAEVELVGPEGSRRIPLRELYQDDGMAFLTKKRDEVLTRVFVPSLEGWNSTYWKLRRRGSFDFPVLSVAAALKMNGDVVEDAKVVLGAVSSYPIELPVDALIGQELTDELVAEYAAASAKPAKPMDNTDYGLAWRKKICASYIKGALKDARGDDPATLGLLARTAARV